MNVVVDLIFAALVVGAFIYGYRKGLLRSVWKIAAFVITTVLVMMLKTPAVEFVSGTEAADRLGSAVSEAISVPTGGGVNIAENLNLPDNVQKSLDVGIEAADNTADAIHDAAARSLTRFLIQVAVCVVIFVLIRLILMAVFMILNGISKVPVINGLNRFFGALLGVVNIIFIVYLLLAAATIFTPSDSQLFKAIDGSYIVKYLYNNNILLKLFMK